MRLFALTVVLTAAGSAAAQPPVLTRSYDNDRTGSDLKESQLMPARVAAHGLIRVGTFAIDHDPEIEAQPLYVPNVQMPTTTSDAISFSLFRDQCG